MRMKVIDIAAFRAGQEHTRALQNSITPKEQLAKTHPAQAAYVYAQNQMSILWRPPQTPPPVARSNSPT
jgi:hypothetical protein